MNAGYLNDDAIAALRLHHRLGNADALDAIAHRLERTLDGIRDLVLRNRLLRFVDFEREVRPTLEIQPFAQRNVALNDVARDAVCSELSDFDVTRKERPDRQDA